MVRISEQLQHEEDDGPQQRQSSSPDSQMDSSPLRSHHEPKRITPPDPLPGMATDQRIIRGYSPLRSTSKETRSIPLPEPPPVSEIAAGVMKALPPVVVVNRSLREEAAAVTTKVDPGEDSFSGIRGGGVENGGGDRPDRTVSSILWRQRREAMVERAALGFRVCAAALCLISFSVMAADKTQGWAGDSFDRYKEYKYCLSVTVIAFVYAGFQAYDLAYNLVTGKHVIQHHLRYYFDFSMDQIFTYLLLSASSSAATRVNMWVSDWGKDKFTEMASASVAMSFLVFTAFASSSLISGYYLCTRSYN